MCILADSMLRMYVYVYVFLLHVYEHLDLKQDWIVITCKNNQLKLSALPSFS